MSFSSRILSLCSMAFIGVTLFVGLAACTEDAATPTPDVVAADTAPDDPDGAAHDVAWPPDTTESDVPPPPPDADSDTPTPPQPDTVTEMDASEDTAEDTADRGEDAPPFGRIPHQREPYPVPTGDLHAGVAVGYLDIPVGVSMAGYGGRMGGVSTTWSGILRGSQGLWGWPAFKAVVFDVDGERMALVKLPMMSSESAITDGAARVLEERYGIDMRGRILTGAGHSHHTIARYWRMPQLLAIAGVDTLDEEVLDRIVRALAETVKAAIDDLGPAEWGYATWEGWDPDDEIYANRRGEPGPDYSKDDRLVVLGVRRPDGTPLATAINFGVHGTGFGSDNDLLTEDVPGAIEMKFEEHFFAETGVPTVGLFLQSGGGSAAPRGGGRFPTPQRLERLGELAAERVLALYTEIEWRTTAALGVRSRRLDLNYDGIYPTNYEDFKDADGKPYAWGAWQCSATDVPAGESMAGHPKKCSAFDSLLALMRISVPFPEVHQVYLSVGRLGPLFFVTLPGEPNYSIIRYLRDGFAALVAGLDDPGEEPLEVMGVGYSQDHLLYLAEEQDWFYGGYETEMTTFGPLGSNYLVDRQLELIHDLLDDHARPVFYEESRDLVVPAAFVPRRFERSIAPGTVVAAAETDYERTAHVRFSWAGGDPSLGPPRVRLQALAADGVSFEDVPCPAGHPGGAYDNTRYHMITRYAPNPAPSPLIREEREHIWLVDWQIPLDFPAGTYRLVASGPYWDGEEREAYALPTLPFDIHQSAAATLTATREDDILQLTLTLPAVPYERHPEGRWPTAGWRLLDAVHGPAGPLHVRAPLLVTFDVDGAPHPDIYAVHFDADAGAYLFDLTTAGIADAEGEISVSAFLAADRIPSMVETTL